MDIKKLYLKPNSLEEAFKLAGEHERNFSFMAGGTDVIVNKFQGNNSSSCLIDISELAELKQILITKDYVQIGAAVKLDDLKINQVIANEFPALINTVNLAGSPVIRKNATIGGNILCENRCTFFNQSDWWREAAGYCLKCSGDVCIATGGKKSCFSKFVSDLAVVLISMNASIEVIEGNNSSILLLEKIYSGNGIEPRELSKKSIIKNIQIPRGEVYHSVFKKLRQRESIDFGSLTTAVTLNKSGRIKIVLGCVDPGPVIIEGNKEDEKLNLIKSITKKCRTIENDSFSRKYRKDMISVFLTRSFDELEL